MRSVRGIHRFLSSGAFAAAWLLFALPGRSAPHPAHPAPPGPKACVDAYTAAQEREQSGHLRAAKDALVLCARAACGKAIGQECTIRFSRLESVDIPSIVAHVTDEKGAQRTDVKVGMDGELLTSHLDGQPVLLDPGLHELSFIADGGLFAKEKVLIAEGQRGRVIDVTMKQGDPKELEKEVEMETAAAEANTAAAGTTAGVEKGAADKAAPVKAPFVPSPNTPRGPPSCMAIYENAEQAEHAGHLREARGLLVGCARAVCGHALLTACSTKFTRLESVEVPSIRPAVTDDSGAVVNDVQVRMDGELLAAHLDGQALRVDPGMHEFTFETESGLSNSQKILIMEGQLDRALPVTVHPPGWVPPPPSVKESTSPSATASREAAAPAPEPERPTSKRSALPYVIGGGIFAVVEAGAAVLYLGQADNAHLATDVSIGASIGVGAAALGVATWLLLSDHHAHEEKPSAPSAYVFGVSPTRSGAMAAVSGHF
jgi:hypothetical protein